VLRKRWGRTYEEASYRELPWFSSKPYPWLKTTVESHGFAPGSRVLDIGCGAGTNALFLASSGFRASGIDLAPGAIRAAEKRARSAGLEADFRVGDALRLPFRRATFGGLVDIGCFHTLPVRLRRQYADEVSRVLRPGGRFALAWVAREFSGAFGPPHRLSVEEATDALEKRFVFLKVEFSPGGRDRLPSYGALLERRSHPQPPARTREFRAGRPIRRRNR
jgi:SAM-dependent methyltransferase